MKIVTTPVFGGSRVSTKGQDLIHLAGVLEDGMKPFCRVKSESLMDDSTMWDQYDVTCKTCLGKMKKLGIQQPYERKRTQS